MGSCPPSPRLGGTGTARTSGVGCPCPSGVAAPTHCAPVRPAWPGDASRSFGRRGSRRSRQGRTTRGSRPTRRPASSAVGSDGRGMRRDRTRSLTTHRYSGCTSGRPVGRAPARSPSAWSYPARPSRGIRRTRTEEGPASVSPRRGTPASRRGRPAASTARPPPPRRSLHCPGASPAARTPQRQGPLVPPQGPERNSRQLTCLVQPQRVETEPHIS